MQGLMEIGTLSAFTSYAVGIFLEPIQQIARILADIIPARPTSNVSAAFWKRYPLFRIPPMW